MFPGSNSQAEMHRMEGRTHSPREDLPEPLPKVWSDADMVDPAA